MTTLTILRASPYSYTYGTLIQARVYAYNSIGWSTASDPNTSGATV